MFETKKQHRDYTSFLDINRRGEEEPQLAVRSDLLREQARQYAALLPPVEEVPQIESAPVAEMPEPALPKMPQISRTPRFNVPPQPQRSAPRTPNFAHLVDHLEQDEPQESGTFFAQTGIRGFTLKGRYDVRHATAAVLILFFGVGAAFLGKTFLGQPVVAQDEGQAALVASIQEGTVLGAQQVTNGAETVGEFIAQADDPAAVDVAPVVADDDAVAFIETSLQGVRDMEKAEFEEKARALVAGHPIEEMLPYIFEQDQIVAAFLIAIAKKESNWGKRVPVLNGQDCFNYWGYRGIRDRMGTGGHTCFDDRRDGVETVAKRIHTLITTTGRDTPAEMIIWKCGFSCAGHSDYSVAKWISDVDLYFRKLQ